MLFILHAKSQMFNSCRVANDNGHADPLLGANIKIGRKIRHKRENKEV